MAYAVEFRVQLEGLGDEVRQGIVRTMDEIGDALATIPSSSALWSSVKDARLHIDVRGYRVVYRIDERAGRITVLQLTRIG